LHVTLPEGIPGEEANVEIREKRDWADDGERDPEDAEDTEEPLTEVAEGQERHRGR